MLKNSAEKTFATGLRHMSTLNKTVCILANSRQADLTGSKIMKSLKDVSGHDDFNFLGYGG